MNANTVYYIMLHHDRLISAASAEINQELGHAEITDCAVLPEYRGHSLTSFLIEALEKKWLEGISSMYFLSPVLRLWDECCVVPFRLSVWRKADQ